MKKVLCIAMMALFAVSVVYAEEAADKPGRFGIGYQGVFVNNDSEASQVQEDDGPYMMNMISLRFAPQPIGGALVFGEYGHTQEDIDGNYEYSTVALTLQGKFLWSLIDRSNSDFYVGALMGLGYYEQEYTSSSYTDTETYVSFIFGPLVGAEWRLTELPEIGFNFELGYNFEVGNTEEKDSSVYDEDDWVFAGSYVSLGATYYF